SPARVRRKRTESYCERSLTLALAEFMPCCGSCYCLRASAGSLCGAHPPACPGEDVQSEQRDDTRLARRSRTVAGDFGVGCCKAANFFCAIDWRLIQCDGRPVRQPRSESEAPVPDSIR